MNNCPLTKLPTLEFEDFGNVCQYKIEYEGEKYFISLGLGYLNCSKTQLYQSTTYLLAGAILNGQLNEGEAAGYKVFSLGSEWKEKLAKIIYPKTPKDKMDNLLKTLYQKQSFDGERVDIYSLVQNSAFGYKHFLKNSVESFYYFGILESQNLITVTYIQIHYIQLCCQLTINLLYKG